MTTCKYYAAAIVSFTIALGAAAAEAQSPRHAAAQSVRPASFDRSPGESPRSVTFGRRRSRLGDVVEQTVSLKMRLNTSLRKGNELLEKNQTVVQTDQRRVVTTAEVAHDCVTAVEVRYQKATRQITSDESAPPTEPLAQPVQGKAYRCRRDAGPDSKLVITDLDGRTPPPEESEIVEQNMEMVGRTNPLAEFLADRTVVVGEAFELPQDIAARLFQLGDRFGEVTRFELELENVDTESEMPCAVFVARVEAASNDSSQMRMQVEGPLVVQIHSCRAVRLSLSGPIGMSETRGSYSTLYQLLGTGQLTMSIDSAYRDAN